MHNTWWLNYGGLIMVLDRLELFSFSPSDVVQF